MNDRDRSHECDECAVRRQASEVTLLFEEKLAELSTIREVGNSLKHITDFSLVCRRLLDVVLKNTPAESGSLMLLDKRKGLLYPVAARATDRGRSRGCPEYASAFRNLSEAHPSGEEVSRRAMLGRKPILIQDDPPHPLSRPTGQEAEGMAGSLLAVPLIVGSDPLGVLTLSHSERNAFGEKDLRLFGILSNFFALVVHASLEHESLRSSEEKYRTLSENASDGIVIIQDGIHVYANRKYRRMTGYSSEELETIAFEALVKPGNRLGGEAALQSSVHSETRMEPFEATLLGREGGGVSVEIHRNSIRLEGKEAHLITIRDLTDRKLLAEQILQARKMEAVATLAGGVAHDFNNLLQAILGYGELLGRDMAENGGSRWKIERITEAAKRGANLTRQLLTFSGKIEPQPRPMDLNRLVRRLKDLLQRILPANVGIAYDLDEEIGIINADFLQMEQVLLNLIVNGRDAMPEGGKITIRTRNVDLTEEASRAFQTLRPGPYICLRVEDTGCGMDEETLRHIFEPFYTTKDVGKGKGLGMAMVYGIVKEHAGEIVCTSAPGSGTTFTVHLPAVTPEK